MATEHEGNGRPSARTKTEIETAKDRPVPLSIIPQKIPDVLSAAHQWVVWRYAWKADQKGGGKWDKPPRNARNTGQYASTTNPQTWATLESAAKSYQDGGFDGVGFVFAADDPFCGIDLDDCRDPDTGELKPWAREIVDRLASYTEVSPSQTGVKIFVRGRLPDGAWNKKAYHDGHVEMYDRTRYFTVTGHHVPGTPVTVEDRQAEVEELQRSLAAPKQANENPPSNGHARALSDAELIEKATAAANGARFAALWRGDTSAYDHDDSRADLALCGQLAFWTDGDRNRIDRLFQQSGLNREKWQRDDYRQRTIDKALEGKTEFYKLGKKREPRKQACDLPKERPEFRVGSLSLVPNSPLMTASGQLKMRVWLFRDGEKLDAVMFSNSPTARFGAVDNCAPPFARLV